MDKLSYLAGIVDGEGTVYLSRRGDAPNLSLRLSVVNTNKTLIDWLLLNFGGKSYQVHRERSAKHKDAYHWHLSTEGAYQLLLQLEPLLIIKSAQAKLAIEAWENRHPALRSERRMPVPQYVLDMRQAYVDKMHELNKKGP